MYIILEFADISQLLHSPKISLTNPKFPEISRILGKVETLMVHTCTSVLLHTPTWMSIQLACIHAFPLPWTDQSHVPVYTHMGHAHPNVCNCMIDTLYVCVCVIPFKPWMPDVHHINSCMVHDYMYMYVGSMTGLARFKSTQCLE